MKTEGQRLLRQYLTDRKVSQRRLAERLDRSEPTVSLWMTGTKTPDLESAVAIEDATGVPPRAWTKTRRRGV